MPGPGRLRELRFLLKINMGSGDLIPWPRGFNGGFMFALGTLIPVALRWGWARCSRRLLPLGLEPPSHPPEATESQQGHPRAAAGGSNAFFSQGGKGMLGMWCLAQLPLAGGGIGGVPDSCCPSCSSLEGTHAPCCVGKREVSVLLLNDARMLKLFCKMSCRSHQPHRGSEPHPAQKIPV